MIKRWPPLSSKTTSSRSCTGKATLRSSQAIASAVHSIAGLWSVLSEALFLGLDLLVPLRLGQQIGRAVAFDVEVSMGSKLNLISGGACLVGNVGEVDRICGGLQMK